MNRGLTVLCLLILVCAVSAVQVSTADNNNNNNNGKTNTPATTGPQQPRTQWNFQSWIANAFKWGGPPLECAFTDAKSGVTFDFKKLRKEGSDFEGEDGTYKYQFNICGSTNTKSLCQTRSGSVCQFSRFSGNYVANLGSWTARPQPVWALLDERDPGKGAKLSFHNGDICWVNHAQVTRTTNVHLVCSDVQDDKFTIKEDIRTCTFDIRLRTPLACAGGIGRGFTFGTFLFFIVLLAACYVAIGCYWNVERNGKQWGTMEAIPHLEFWQTVPEHTKNGVMWTVERVQILIGRKEASPEGYAKVANDDDSADKDKKKDSFEDM